LHEEKDTLAGALAELKRRLSLAHEAVRATDAAQRRARARTTLKQLQDCAGALDVLIPHPDGSGLYEPGDPPAVSRAAALAVALCTEVRALQIADVEFPKYRWDLAAKSDLRKALTDVLHAGWRWTPGVHRGPITRGQRQPPSITFAKIFDELNKRLRGSLVNNTERSDAAA
jgi:hypothetical protein